MKTGSLSKADGKVDVDNNETCCQSAKNWCFRNIIHVVRCSELHSHLFVSIHSTFTLTLTNTRLEQQVLLTMAVGAVGGAIIGSLDSCNSTLENITVTRDVTREVVRSVNVTQNVTVYRNVTQNVTVYTNVTQNVTVYTNVTQNVTVKVVTPLSAYILIDASMSMAWAESGATNCPNGLSCHRNKYVTTNQNAQGTNDDTTQFSCLAWDDPPWDCWPTPSAVTIDSWAYDPTAQGDRFDKAKLAFDEILRKLDTALNNGTTNKFRSAILQWAHDTRGVVVESHLTSDTNVRHFCLFLLKHTQLTRKIQTTLEANQNMVINGAPNTCWAPGLCQCYSQLKNDPESVNASKMCILMTDGELWGRMVVGWTELDILPTLETVCLRKTIQGSQQNSVMNCTMIGVLSRVLRMP